jgi:hypothetical protein
MVTHNADGGAGLRIWRVAGNIRVLNKKTQAADKGWYCRLMADKKAIKIELEMQCVTKRYLVPRASEFLLNIIMKIGVSLKGRNFFTI